MKKELLINGGALNAPVFSALAAEQFLTENYSFRRNQLNGKVEFATKSPDGQASDYRPLTQEALNSIILRAKREDICEGSNPKTDIVEYIHSEEVCAYNPYPRIPGQPATVGRTEPCGPAFLSTARHQFRAVGIPLRLDSLDGGPLAPDGHPAWQRDRTYAHWRPGMW